MLGNRYHMQWWELVAGVRVLGRPLRVVVRQRGQLELEGRVGLPRSPRERIVEPQRNVEQG